MENEIILPIKEYIYKKNRLFVNFDFQKLNILGYQILYSEVDKKYFFSETAKPINPLNIVVIEGLVPKTIIKTIDIKNNNKNSLFSNKIK